MHKEREISDITKELIATASLHFCVLYWLHVIYGEIAYCNTYTMLTIRRLVNRIVPISAFFSQYLSNYVLLGVRFLSVSICDSKRRGPNLTYF